MNVMTATRAVFVKLFGALGRHTHVDGITDATEVSENSLELSPSQAAKIALWVAISLILAVALSVALAAPVMTAFGMSAL